MPKNRVFGRSEGGYGPECWSQISGISTADSGGPVNEDELPGQMTIFDFPDAIPEGGQNG